MENSVFPFGKAPTVVESATELVQLVQGLTNWLFVGFLLTAVVILILAAFEFLAAGGDPQRTSSVRWKLLWAGIAIGLAVLARTLPAVIQHIITA